MPSDKRQRQDEGRLLRLEEQRVATQKHQRRRQARSLVYILVAIVAVAGLIAVFSADDATNTSTSDTTAATGTTLPEGNPNVVLPGAGASITGETPCPAADGSEERTTSFEQAPPMCIDPEKSYAATLVTTEGDIVLELDTANAPETVNNFVVLARYHFYDNVPFHRIVPGFVNQAGDPVGPTPGTGGPGYTIADDPPEDPATAYVKGTLAMARTAEPNSGSSQFFLVIDDLRGGLSDAGNYTVFGKIVGGQEISDKINGFAGVEPDYQPTKLVAITEVRITES